MNNLLGYVAFAVTLCGTVFGGEEVQGVAESGTQKTEKPYSVQFVPVADNVKLEVVDWGGIGRPLVLLAGLGGTVHAFDQFAPKLTSSYRVYGITRRGFGASTAAASGYSTDELADDIVKVIDHLGLEKPVLAGHSFAGAELSSIATRYPGKAAGLIYLDAGYSYAFYDESHGDALIETNEFRRKLERYPIAPNDADSIIEELLNDLPRLEKSLREEQKKRAALHRPAKQPPMPPPAMVATARAILLGQKKFTSISGPILAIYAFPKPGIEPSPSKEAQVNAFEAGVPSARVVRLPNASHHIYKSNEEDVLREMRAFTDTLP